MMFPTKNEQQITIFIISLLSGIILGLIVPFLDLGIISFYLSLEASEKIAVASTIIALASFSVAIWQGRLSRRHNILSVKPIPEITSANYENSLSVTLRNNGSGPLIIKSLTVKKGNSIKDSIIAWMRPLPNDRAWNTYSTNFINRSLLPGQTSILLELTQRESEPNSIFKVFSTQCREDLYELSCNIEYTDVYKTTFKIYTKELEWFNPDRRI